LWLNRANRTDCVIRNRPVLVREFKLEDWMWKDRYWSQNWTI
jgi:hypothetical protein